MLTGLSFSLKFVIRMEGIMNEPTMLENTLPEVKKDDRGMELQSRRPWSKPTFECIRLNEALVSGPITVLADGGVYS